MGFPLRKACTFLFLFFAFYITGFGQNGVTITSPQSPGPTTSNPIPVTIKFDGPVNTLLSTDFSLSNGNLQNLTRTDVNFEFQNSQDLDQFDFNISSTDIFFAYLGDDLDGLLNRKLARSVISIDFNSQNELFYLTFGEGIYKVNPTGLKERVIPASEFDTPLDMVLNRNNGYIYVADSGTGQILIFDDNYQNVLTIGIGGNAERDDPRGATGLDLDNNGYIYDADNYTGNDPGGIDEIKVYDPNGTFIPPFITDYEGSPIVDPFRIAVDNQNNIYLSDSGGENGRILIYDENYNPIGKIEGDPQGTPGSLVVDDYGYLYVVDYKNDFNLNDLFNDPFQIIDNYETIRDTRYTIKVYDTNNNYILVSEFGGENLNLPVDLAIGACGSIYVNNLQISGPGPSGSVEYDGQIYPTNVSSNFDFTLKEYEREDIFTAEIIPQEAGLVELNLLNAYLFECDPQPSGEFSIEYRREQQPPTADCNNFEIALDENGIAQITPEEVYAGSENLELSIDKSNFNCSDIGSNSVQLTVKDPDTGLTDSCTATITVKDSTDPEIVECLQNIEVTLQEGESFSIPDFRNDINGTDNCDTSLEFSQSIAAGTEINESTPVTIRLTDDSGNYDECTFQIVIERQQPPTAECNDFDVVLDENGIAQITALEVYAGTEDLELSIDKSNFNCSDIGTNSVQLTVKDPDTGLTDSCTAMITVKDSTDPEIVECLQNMEVTLQEGESFSIPDFRNDINGTDTCDTSLEFYQSIAAGSEINESTPVTIRLTDDSGNYDECTFQIVIERQQPPTAECNDFDVVLDENGIAQITAVEVYAGTEDLELSIDKSNFNCSDIGTNSVQLTVKDPDTGLTDSCTATITVKDSIDPAIDCIADQTATVNEGEAYTLPDYRSQLNINDNCDDYNVVQDPMPQTEITEDTEVSFTVTDQAGNIYTCSFQLNLITEGTLSINCPSDKTESFDDGCSFIVPDYTSEAVVTNGDGAQVTQEPVQGTLITDSQFEVRLRVEQDGSSDECTFLVNLEDTIAPEVLCVGTYDITLNDGETKNLEASQIDNGSSDTCGSVSLSLDKTEFTAADEGNNTVTLSVRDEAGNVDTCQTIVTVTVSGGNDNQPPVANDEEYSTEINTTLNISEANGVLVNDTDPNNDDLTAVLDTDVQNGSLQLNLDGSFTYTPDTGFVGQDFFTYMANDGELNSNSISVTINVEDSSGEFGCTSQVLLELGPDGDASLDIGLLYQGDADGLQLSADILEFTCDDIGENTVTLSYSGRVEGTCTVKVIVVDNTAPVLQLRNISIDLDLQGNAEISFDDINNGSFDECDTEVTYTLSKTFFSCKDLGENTVIVTGEDDSGNIATASAVVTVFAEYEICNDPLPGSEYIFIYPNPNSGSFKIATPADVSIQRIEVFDKRGRFIRAKNFESTVTEYAMDLGPLQEGIYVLKLDTNEGVYIKRIIFKRD